MSDFTQWLAALTDDDLIMLDHAIKRAYGRKSEEAQKRSSEWQAALRNGLGALGIESGHLFTLGDEYAEWYKGLKGNENGHPYQGVHQAIGAETIDGITYVYFDGGRLPYDVFKRCKTYEPHPA